MKLFACPSCARVYYLPEDSQYLCGRNHAPAVWPDGRVRRFNISEKTETNRPPWAIPTVVEERELLKEDSTETWVEACPYPDDADYGDIRRHFGYGAPGGKHLTREQVASKYGMFLLRPVQI